MASYVPHHACVAVQTVMVSLRLWYTTLARTCAQGNLMTNKTEISKLVVNCNIFDRMGIGFVGNRSKSRVERVPNLFVSPANRDESIFICTVLHNKIMVV